jgi:hypothetical protein
MDANQFFSEGGSYAINQAIKGQTAVQMYDPLAQMVYKPDIRGTIAGKAAIVLPYAKTGYWGLWSQIQSLLGLDKKMVKASTFYWAEYDIFETQAFSVLGVVGAPPSGGVAVTVAINRFSMSANGLFSKPIAGFQGFFKHNRQKVNITAVNETAAGTINVTLQPINNQVLDLTQKKTYILVQSPMLSYNINATGPIPTHGEVGNPPILYKSFVQKYEDGLSVDESEIDNYVYDKTFFIAKGLDPFGKEIDYWYIPSLSAKAEAKVVVNRNMKTLFDQRDYINNEGFDGTIPTIEKYGMFNFSYDTFISGSFKSLLFTMIKNLRKVNGSNDYLLAHDFNFGIDWSEAIAAMVRLYKQNYRYALFGDGGEGSRNFQYFDFKDWTYNEYNFRAFKVDMFDDYQYGHILSNFAMLMPLKAFTDTMGNKVPIVNFVNIEGAEPGKDMKIWVDDARERLERCLRIGIKDNFGIEIHSPTRLGMIWRGASNNQTA